MTVKNYYAYDKLIPESKKTWEAKKFVIDKLPEANNTNEFWHFVFENQEGCVINELKISKIYQSIVVKYEKTQEKLQLGLFGLMNHRNEIIDYNMYLNFVNNSTFLIFRDDELVFKIYREKINDSVIRFHVDSVLGDKS